MRTVIGLFDTQIQARRAIEALKTAGFPDEQMSIVMRNRHDQAVAGGRADRAENEAAAALGGGVVGSLAGLAVGLSALSVPGIGPVLAAGPLAATVAGGAMGAVTGGLLGALIDEGVPEEDARHYQGGVERGAVLLTVTTPPDREHEVREILRRNGMRDLSEHRVLWDQNPDHRYGSHPSDEFAAADMDGAVAAGGATGAILGGLVGGLAAGPAGAAVGVALGAAAGAGTGAVLDFNAVEPEFQDEWQESPNRDRQSWDQASAAYRYGWESFDDAEFRGRPWREVRRDLERRWPGGEGWAEYEPLVRSAWERRARENAAPDPEPLPPT